MEASDNLFQELFQNSKLFESKLKQLATELTSSKKSFISNEAFSFFKPKRRSFEAR